MKRAYRTALVLLLAASNVRAEGPAAATDATAKARELFKESMAVAQQGDLVGALRGFEAAYAASPHYSVLYNIAQTLATLGRPVEAIAAFQRYLSDGGKHISETRRGEVQALIDANRQRIGRLRIKGGNDATRVWLDGVELSAEQRSDVVLAAKGEHSVVFWNGPGAPESRSVSVTSDDTLEITIPETLAAPSAARRLTPLFISCDVPDITVDVAGVGSIKTPQTRPWLVPVGPLSLRFSRAGYPTLSQKLSTLEDEPAQVACHERPLSPLPPLIAARLNLALTPADADVFVDGLRYRGEVLPAGVHQLRVQQDGFVPVKRSISLAAGQMRLYEISLTHTPRERARIARARARSRTTALVLGGLSLGALSACAGIYAWNSSRYDEWQAKRAQGTATPEDAAKIQRGDDAALGLLVAGGALGASGAWVLFSQP